jgi:hypothetical protein
MAVSQAVGHCKERRQALVGGYMTRALDSWPRSALAGGAHLVHHQRVVNLVVTNVPGPPIPLYCLGARMLEAFPIVPLAANLSVGVAAFSYDGQLSIGILADRDHCLDIEVLAHGIVTSFAELLAAAGDDTGKDDPRGAPTPDSSPTDDVLAGRGQATQTVNDEPIPSHGLVRQGRPHAGSGNQGGGRARARRPSPQAPPALEHLSSGPKGAHQQ